ncbi:MAG TPA: 16S rRNA (guanine(527)-N(7))-methyltransferase RsmG [Mycobacterium sp.]|nr:16S rRNA (guanine(527)-N(7))-methyltransferase RsmG [Mycobacterium sp.]
MPAPVPAPAVAEQIFGERLPMAQRYAELLATDGVERGLIGPHEAARIWDRHLLNCAVLGELVPLESRIVDVGSGAGLPGMALACRRPDLQVDLVESLTRRVTFLRDTAATLGLAEQVRVVHGRAEDREVRGSVGGAGWVTARAVAPLERLVGWCLPVLKPGGKLLAMKGAQAEAEMQAHRAAIGRLGGDEVSIMTCGNGIVDPPVNVVVVRRGLRRAPSAKGSR